MPLPCRPTLPASRRRRRSGEPRSSSPRRRRSSPSGGTVAHRTRPSARGHWATSSSSSGREASSATPRGHSGTGCSDVSPPTTRVAGARRMPRARGSTRPTCCSPSACSPSGTRAPPRPSRDRSPPRRWHAEVMTDDWPWAAEFEPRGTYLNSATMGLPPRVTLDALAGTIDEWREGVAHAPGYDAVIASARASFAGLVHVPASSVAIGSQVSSLVSYVAAGVPSGSTVLVPEGEFTSVTFPFLAQSGRGVRVREVPLEELPEHVDGGTGLV